MKNVSRNVVFAQNIKHASAFIKWYNLNEDRWHPNEYGGLLIDRYDQAILVRPIDGVTNEHFLWVANILYPKIQSPSKIIPIHWNYEDFTV